METNATGNIRFLSGGGQMGQLIREKDWSQTSLGEIPAWPPNLLITLSILLNSKSPMFLFWGTDLICFYNDAYLQLLGEEGKHPLIFGMKAELAWKETWEIVNPTVMEVLNNGIGTLGEDQLIPIYRNGGIEDSYWTFSFNPVKDEAGKTAGVFVTCMETTDKVMLSKSVEINKNELEKEVKKRTKELVQSNEALKRSEEKYHLMVEEVQDYAILYLDRQGFVENWNTGAEKIKGYTAQEIIGKNFSNFYTEEDKKINLPQTLLNRAVKEGRAVQQGWRVRKDGSRFWASVAITAVHSETGEVIGFSKVTHDLTDKKKADDAIQEHSLQLQAKNNELEKMNKELQSFAYISSHDLQEPLRKIQTFAHRISDTEAENLSERGRDMFARMQSAALRMQTLINDLLVYSRTATADRKYERTDLNKVLEEVKQDLKEEIQQTEATIISENLCEVSIIPFQFRQLLQNLISNSLKFSIQGNRPLIKIASEIVEAENIAINPLSSAAQYCHISIADNGIGFEARFNEKIFEVFQRLHTSQEYKGTGIGLAIVKKIVENHGGMITAKGELNQGATFDIYLPLK